MDNGDRIMTMKKIFIYAALVLSAAAGCSRETTLETESVTVDLHIGTDTKADLPLTPDIENLIYDIWVIQYNDKNILNPDYTRHYRADIAGQTSISLPVELNTGEGNTICVVANLDRGNSSASRIWHDNLEGYVSTLHDFTSTIIEAETGNLEEMPMCGYWTGDITSGTTSLDVSLSRVLTRINIVLENETGGTVNDNVSISNIPVRAYLFPDVHIQESRILPDAAYLTYPFSKAIEIEDGKTLELYYYCAPNLCSADGSYEEPDRAMKLTIGGNSIVLSSGSPSAEYRDYNLYHNSNYTFTITLK